MKKFKLGSLPKIILFEVFRYVDAYELLEFRFINKNLFSAAQDVIHNHLCYSTYSFINNDFSEVQHDFIEKNALKIKHLNIMDINLPNYLDINEDIQAYEDVDGGTYLNNSIGNQFTNLISLNLSISGSEDEEYFKFILNSFKELLFKVSDLSLVFIYDFNLNLVFPLLNPDKLKALKIKISADEESDTILDISNFYQFKFLEHLEIDTEYLVIEANYQLNSDEAIFPSLKTLKLYGAYESDFQIFFNIPTLQTLYMNQVGAYAEILELLKESVIPKVHLKCYVGNFDFKDGDFNIDSIKYISDIKNKTELLLLGAEDSKGEGRFENMPLFVNVEEITFQECKINIHYVFRILEYFPHIKKVNFKDSHLFTFSNEPLVFTKKPESFLFCVEESTSIFNHKETILSLLDAIPTYVLY